MDYIIRRCRTLSDGRVEVFTPVRNPDGYFVLADRGVDPSGDRAINQFFVKDPAAVVARLRRGGVSLRMKGDITGQPNLVHASEIELIAVPDEDPFAAFTEWSSSADDDAYRDL